MASTEARTADVPPDTGAEPRCQGQICAVGAPANGIGADAQASPSPLPTRREGIERASHRVQIGVYSELPIRACTLAQDCW